MIRLGFKENPRLYPDYHMKNVTLPVIVTYAKSGQEEQAVSFVRNMASLLPDHLTLMYNIGLETYELFLVSEVDPIYQFQESLSQVNNK